MHTFLVIIHVSLMITSLVLMPLAVGFALSGFRASVKLATGGMIATVIGFLAGVVLLFEAPILSSCVILTSYLISIIAVYALGFGWGKVTNARLLKKAVN